jgi:CheY-like chemotaxis protein
VINKKILIVDDQSFNIDALMIILKYKIGLNSKFYCETALSGKQAIEIVTKDIQAQKNMGKSKSKFHLILLDCNMPELDGYETTKIIRQLLWENEMR